jgi:predicted RNA binding protein YcfA (HicA-like mRNA interferase family)
MGDRLSLGLSDGLRTLTAMAQLPRMTGRDLVRALCKLGWVVVAQKGSHAQLKHPDRGGRVTIPLHAGQTIGPRLLRSILNQAGLTVDDLHAAL